LAGRGPVPPGLNDIGINEGTFTFLFGVVTGTGVGCWGVEVEREGTVGVGAGTVGCTVVDGTGGSRALGDANVVWGGCEVLVEDSWFREFGASGDNLRRAARAAAS